MARETTRSGRSGWLMTGRRRSALVLLFLTVAFVLFVILFERDREQQRRTALARHSREMGATLWNLDRATAADYLGVSAELEHYEQVTVRDGAGRVFLAVTGPGESRLDGVLRAVGLIRIRELAHPIVYRDQHLGEIQATLRDRSIYTYLYLALLFLLVHLALTSYLRTLGSKRDLEASVAEQTADLVRLNADLRQMNRELQGLDEMKTNLLSNVSHELRTPLVSVRGYTELIAAERSGPVTEKQKQQLGAALKSIDQLTRLIDDLLQYSLMDRGKMTYRMRAFDLAGVAREAADQARPLAGTRRLRLDEQLPAAPLIVSGDPDRIKQVIANLLDNAIKFTPPGGGLTLTVTGATDEARIRLCDTGIGIPREKLEKIFERFYQVDSSMTRGYGGTGIGLALCREIVKAHGGTIRAESETGKGTTMIVTLPRSGGVEEPAAGKAAARPVPVGAAGKTVLFVDDDPDVLQFMKEALADTDFRLVTTDDGARALAMMQEEHFEVILLDIAMAEMNGIELCRRIRNNPAHHGIPVLMVTARVEESVRQRALEAGADGFLTKPFSIAELVRQIDRGRKPAPG